MYLYVKLYNTTLIAQIKVLNFNILYILKKHSKVTYKITNGPIFDFDISFVVFLII